MYAAMYGNGVKRCNPPLNWLLDATNISAQGLGFYSNVFGDKETLKISLKKISCTSVTRTVKCQVNASVHPRFLFGPKVLHRFINACSKRPPSLYHSPSELQRGSDPYLTAYY